MAAEIKKITLLPWWREWHRATILLVRCVGQHLPEEKSTYSSIEPLFSIATLSSPLSWQVFLAHYCLRYHAAIKPQIQLQLKLTWRSHLRAQRTNHLLYTLLPDAPLCARECPDSLITWHSTDRSLVRRVCSFTRYTSLWVNGAYSTPLFWVFFILYHKHVLQPRRSFFSFCIQIPIPLPSQKKKKKKKRSILKLPWN